MVRRTIFWIGFLFAWLALLEGVSTVAVWILSHRAGNEHLVAQIKRFHPLVVSESKVGNPIPPYQRADAASPFRFDPRSGYANRADANFDVGLRIDRQGFICNRKCEEFSRAKPANEARVFLFGGSSVAGVGVNNGADTISGRLEDRFNAATGGVGNGYIRVVNAGVGGYFSALELSAFLNNVMFFEPDVVVFLNGHNDYRQWMFSQSQKQSGRAVAPNLGSYDYEVMRGFETVQTLTGSMAHLVLMTNEYFPILYYTVVLAKHVRFSMSSSEASPDDATRKNAPSIEQILMDRQVNSVATYVMNMSAAVGAAEALGIDSLVCLQPTIGFPRKPQLTERETKIFAGLAAPDASPNIDRYFAAAQAAFLEQRQLPQKHDHFCDLTDLFSMFPGEAYVDNVHYTTSANDMIAEALYERLKDIPSLGRGRENAAAAASNQSDQKQ